MHLLIAPNGSARCLYTEAMDLAALGRLTITRASHVEPKSGEPRAESGEPNPLRSSTLDSPPSALLGWFADLRPANGPSLGPFRLRSEALAAERAWLEAHLLGVARDETAFRDQPTAETGPPVESPPALSRPVCLHRPLSHL